MNELTSQSCNFVFGLHLCVNMTHLSCLSCICCATRPLHQWASRRPPVSVPVWMCRLVWSGSLDVIDMLWTGCLGYSCSVCSQQSHITYGPVALFRTGHQQYRGLPTTASPHPAWTLPWWTLPGWERRGVQIFLFFCFYAIWYHLCFISCYLLSVMAMFTGDTPHPQVDALQFISLCVPTGSQHTTAAYFSQWTQFQ